jgi:hypothetical protein
MVKGGMLKLNGRDQSVIKVLLSSVTLLKYILTKIIPSTYIIYRFEWNRFYSII